MKHNRGWMMTVTLNHLNTKYKAIYRRCDGTLYATSVSGRLWLVGDRGSCAYYDITPKTIKNHKED